MTQVTIQTEDTQTQIQVQLPNHITQCIVKAIFAALPVFVRALMDCLTQPPTTDTYNPGQRRRCD
jgi:hypothetical protein